MAKREKKTATAKKKPGRPATVAPKEAVAKKAPAKKAAPKKTVAKKAVTKEAAPKKTAPKKTAPKKAVPPKATAKKAAAKKVPASRAAPASAPMMSLQMTSERIEGKAELHDAKMDLSLERLKKLEEHVRIVEFRLGELLRDKTEREAKLLGKLKQVKVDLTAQMDATARNLRSWQVFLMALTVGSLAWFMGFLLR